MPPDPSADELVAFAESLLVDLGPHLRERAVLEETIEQHRDLWLVLYRVSAQVGEPAGPGVDEPGATAAPGG